MKDSNGPRLRPSAQFLGEILAAGIVVHLVSVYLDAKFPTAGGVLLYLVLFAVLLVLVLFALRWLDHRLRSVRYAVSAFVLNDENELLVYMHPFHKVFLQPGGRVRIGEVPHDALARCLMERLALAREAYEFDPRIHDGLDNVGADVGKVVRVPAPFLVQREHEPQRGGVRTHYDLFYVLKLLDRSQLTAPERYQPVRFVALSTLRDMAARSATRPDLVDGYERLVAALRPMPTNHTNPTSEADTPAQ
jgi:ADP-ribose pyrophosphatase YjhB (NUDIX family)